MGQQGLEGKDKQWHPHGVQLPRLVAHILWQCRCKSALLCSCETCVPCWAIAPKPEEKRWQPHGVQPPPVVWERMDGGGGGGGGGGMGEGGEHVGGDGMWEGMGGRRDGHGKENARDGRLEERQKAGCTHRKTLQARIETDSTFTHMCTEAHKLGMSTGEVLANCGAVHDQPLVWGPASSTQQSQK